MKILNNEKMLASIILAVAIVVSPNVHAEAERSSAIIKTFKEQNECPSTGLKAVKGKPDSYKCPDYVVDHGIPRCADGADDLYNLFYQKYDKDMSIKKDTDEKRLCARLRALEAFKAKTLKKEADEAKRIKTKSASGG